MKRHGSMNHIYRLVWSQVLNGWVAVAETARGRGKSSSRKLIAAALSLTAIAAQAAPDGGQVTSGAGSVKQSGNTTTITQSSQNLSLNWSSFNVAKHETVNFVQPSAAAIAVNRIFDTNGSQILGNINANGQVYLINPNGILFGQGAQVNVGGLVASTLDINDASLNGNTRSFSGTGSGSILNLGTIHAAKGGYVALLGNTVSNQGTITTPLGTVALGAGNAVTLNFNGNSLVKMQIDQSVLNSLAENGGLIQADGGMVVMSAGAKDALLASVVNNTGVIEARTVENHEGVITLLGGMTAGTVNVGGTLDASAPNGGDGGFIETSAAHVKVADNAKITTRAANGQTGQWLIDPNDFTIAASGGNMTAATVANNLSTTNFEITTAIMGTTGGNGDIFVNQALSWTSANTLTLTAQRNIAINHAITATNGGLRLNAVGSISAPAAVNVGTFTLANGTWSQIGDLPAFSATDFRISGGTFIRALGGDGSTSSAYQLADVYGLQGIGSASMLGKSYVLANNIDASGTSNWNAGAGFAPIMATIPDNSSDCTQYGECYSQITPFSGTFNGVGLTISNLVINRPTTAYVGLFGRTDTGASVRNVGLVGGSVSGQGHVGGLVGSNIGTISNSYATGSVSGSATNGYSIGGLAGENHNLITNSYATGNVNGVGQMGGLVGYNSRTIIASYATGSVTGSGSDRNIGGLVGYNAGPVSYSYATGRVSGGAQIGGLMGFNNINTNVTNSYWNKDVITAGIGYDYSSASTVATGLTSLEMQTAANFAGFNFTATPGAAGNNWVMVNVDGSLNNAGSKAGATRPMLASEYSTTINNAHQLQLMAMAPAASYTLGTNINAAATGLIGGISTDIWGSAGFMSIGNSTSNFTGTFDGLGHTISNLTQNNALNASGLFSQIGAAGTVKNLGLTGVTVIKEGYNNNNYLIPVGALTGTNAGRISNVYSTGTMSNAGPDYNAFGGLVGVNTGLISNAYSSVTLSSGMWGTSVGGLVGINSGTISSSYAAGAVTGNGRDVKVGGLVGQNTIGGSIDNSYATGAVSSGGTPDSNAIGGLVGLMNGGA